MNAAVPHLFAVALAVLAWVVIYQLATKCAVPSIVARYLGAFLGFLVLVYLESFFIGGHA